MPKTQAMNATNEANGNYAATPQSNEIHSGVGVLDKTGKILELQSIDLQSNTYCYYKSGKELAYSFPDLTNKDNPVLFIVKMKA